MCIYTVKKQKLKKKSLRGARTLLEEFFFKGEIFNRNF